MANISKLFSTALLVIAVTIVLGIMIFVHEWGHFIAAKLSGVRVEVFSLGFGPRLFGVKRGDTDYRLSALPFGGYVRMAGDNPVEERTGAAYEFLSKPSLGARADRLRRPRDERDSRLRDFLGDYFFAGSPAVTSTSASPRTSSPSRQTSFPTGIKVGDRILDINGVNTPTWEAVFTKLETVQARHHRDAMLVARSRAESESISIKVAGKITLRRQIARLSSAAARPRRSRHRLARRKSRTQSWRHNHRD